MAVKLIGLLLFLFCFVLFWGGYHINITARCIGVDMETDEPLRQVNNLDVILDVHDRHRRSLGGGC